LLYSENDISTVADDGNYRVTHIKGNWYENIIE
jgi:hypothetical protein